MLQPYTWAEGMKCQRANGAWLSHKLVGKCRPTSLPGSHNSLFSSLRLPHLHPKVALGLRGLDARNPPRPTRVQVDHRILLRHRARVAMDGAFRPCQALLELQVALGLLLRPSALALAALPLAPLDGLGRVGEVLDEWVQLAPRKKP